MCGIVGSVSSTNITTILLDCLQRLEYRGYDSAGIALLNSKNGLVRARAVGKISNLRNVLNESPLEGNIGIAHTRWATHGAPTELNAHPHFSHNEIAVVHNGIIENYVQLRDELLLEGYEFFSETDTEVVAHLIHKYYQQVPDFLKAVFLAQKRLEGMFALAIINGKEPFRIIGARQGSSLVVGSGERGNFIASDSIALSQVVKEIAYLEDGDLVDISRDTIQIYDTNLLPVSRQKHAISNMEISIALNSFQHYMQKEIFEQPQALRNTLQNSLNLEDLFGKLSIRPEHFEFSQRSMNLKGDGYKEIFSQIKRVQIVACGSSYYAGLTAKYWMESIANLPCRVDIASELRYCKMLPETGTLLIAISQSGETADTLAVVRKAKQSGYLACLAISNVATSALMREADLKFLTCAGVEIGVAATKTFTTQLVTLFLLAIFFKYTIGGKNVLSEELLFWITQLQKLPEFAEETLKLDCEIKKLAEFFKDKQHILYVGRSECYPIALEGALKMKEIAYIHAEAYPAGELKHGPLALVDKDMPVVVLLPKDNLVSKMFNAIKEIQARQGEVFVFTDQGLDCSDILATTIIKLPEISPELAPIIYALPMQLLAYHTAVLKDFDVDQPRNLAKSVTVE